MHILLLILFYFIFLLIFYLIPTYIYIYTLLCNVSSFILFFCTVHWADPSWPTFHYWLYPVWLCMWQINKNLEPWTPWTTPWRTEILQCPQCPPAQESTCTGPSEACQWTYQWFRGELGESVVVRWDQNPALWHQLNSPCLEEEECCLWPQEHHPHCQTWRWKHYALGCFSAKGTGQLHHIKGTMDGAMYRQGQGIENGSWMGIPAWQWPKTHGQGNKGVAQEGAH